MPSPMMQKTDTYAANGALISSVDNRDLSAMKLKKWNDINAYREVVLNRGIWFMGYLFGSDERSRANVTGVVAGVTAGIPLPDGFTWRDNNNNNVPFNAQALVGLAAYIMLYVNQVYAYSWGLKNVVDACSTLAEVDAFIVSQQAWPDGNMDGSKPA